MARTADVIMRCLARSGTARVFGAPGEGSCLDIMDAARCAKIDFVATDTSGAAAIMAATDGDLCGRPGVCVTALGSSAARAVSGIAEALADRVPLVVLAGSPARRHRRDFIGGRLDQNRLFDGVTKDQATITPARASRLIVWALEESMAPPAGPVYLELPADTASATARDRLLTPGTRRRPTPSPSAVRRTGMLLTRAGRVVVVAGNETREPGAAAAFRELVEHLGTPVLTTKRAKGVLPEDHPLSAGVLVAGRMEQELIGRSNCVLAIGLDPAELFLYLSASGPDVVTMSERPTSSGGYPTTLEICGDLPTSLSLLRESLPPAGEWNFAEWAKRGEQFKTKTRAVIAEACCARGDHGISPHRVVELAREVFPRETTVTVDSGAHALAVAIFWSAYGPKDYRCCGEFGGSGYALPAGIAATVHRGKTPVLAFMGESGFLMNLSEIATASRLGCPLVAVVFVDETLSRIRVAQEQRRYAPLGVTVGTLDLPKIAEGFGALGTFVEDEDGLRSALQDAVVTTRPAIIAARVNPHGYRKMYDLLRGKSAL